MFKRCLLALALTGLPGLAQAADLPSRHAPPPVYTPPIFSWTGVYLGGEIGYGWGQNGISLPAVPVYTRSSPEGVLGGAHVGYNYQINQLVFGLEGDVDGTSVSKSIFDPVTGTSFGARIPVEGSVRGRVGYAWDRALFYATGGAAFADLENSFTGGLTPYYNTSSGRAGWTVGGGVEYAITNNWSVRGEYRYSDFGHEGTVVAPVAVPVDTHVTEHAVRVGFSYKFEMYAPPPPVISKY